MRNARLGSGNVFEDAGFSPEEAVELRFKAQLYQAVLLRARRYTPKQLETLLGEEQPRISELLNGKIANKSIEKLLSYAGHLGLEPQVKFRRTRKAHALQLKRAARAV
jgi:predicted XRE-type DNA-binding protein